MCFFLKSQLNFSFWEGCATATAVTGWRSVVRVVKSLYGLGFAVIVVSVVC